MKLAGKCIGLLSLTAVVSGLPGCAKSAPIKAPIARIVLKSQRIEIPSHGILRRAASRRRQYLLSDVSLRWDGADPAAAFSCHMESGNEQDDKVLRLSAARKRYRQSRPVHPAIERVRCFDEVVAVTARRVTTHTPEKLVHLNAHPMRLSEGLEHLRGSQERGFTDVRVHLASWNEWSRDPSLPIETGLPYKQPAA